MVARPTITIRQRDSKISICGGGILADSETVNTNGAFPRVPSD